jgi:BirA family biotin operon repressor/biotin-[acetyl-CoA-carboxylase] ligase
MQKKLQSTLAALPLAEIRYFDSIGSTNDEALAWATEDARDYSLVMADHQTTGRGREGRKWITFPETALAFSLILRPIPEEAQFPSLFTGLGALGLLDALKTLGLKAKVKWPNDVLVRRKKVAGILVESVWSGDALDTVVLGMGVNVLMGSNPPDDELLFPATNVESELGSPPDRLDFLREILTGIIKWRSEMRTGSLVNAWEKALAFKGELVDVWQGKEEPVTGRILGLEPDGSLRLRTMRDDKIITIQVGEIHLRPAV